MLGKNSHDPQTAGISDFIEMIRSQNDVEK